MPQRPPCGGCWNQVRGIRRAQKTHVFDDTTPLPSLPARRHCPVLQSSVKKTSAAWLGARCRQVITERPDLGSLAEARQLPRKEVIQPQLPLRLPCYDFVPITSPALDGCLPAGNPPGWPTGFRRCRLS